MLVNITNTSSTAQVYLSSLFLPLAASATVSVQRTQAQVDADLNLKALILAGSVTVTFTAEAGDELAGDAMGDNVAAEALVIHKTFAAGAGGSADDVVIYTANSPFAMQILESTMVTTTAVSGSSVTIRTALAAGGTDLSGALASAATGRTSSVKTSTSTLAKGSSLVLRRSDSGIAGEIIIRALRTA